MSWIVTYSFEARCGHASCFSPWRMSRKLFRGYSDVWQVRALRTSMLLPTLCFTTVSHASSYKQCVLQKKSNWQCFQLQPLHMQHWAERTICSMKPLDRANIFYHSKRRVLAFLFRLFALFLPSLQNVSTVLGVDTLKRMSTQSWSS